MQARLAKRVAMDVLDLQQWCETAGGACIEDIESSVAGTRLLVVTMRGAAGTPYADGWYQVNCEVGAEYPVEAPLLFFRTKIWHPNVHSELGSVCMDVLSTRWSPVTRLSQLFSVYLPELMRNPNPDSPLNIEAARQINSDRAKYDAYAHEPAVAHAVPM